MVLAEDVAVFVLVNEAVAVFVSDGDDVALSEAVSEPEGDELGEDDDEELALDVAVRVLVLELVLLGVGVRVSVLEKEIDGVELRVGDCVMDDVTAAVELTVECAVRVAVCEGVVDADWVADADPEADAVPELEREAVFVLVSVLDCGGREGRGGDLDEGMYS